MKYIVIENHKDGTGDWITSEFDSKQDAIRLAEIQYNYLTAKEKAKRDVIVLESVNPDEDAENHFDGNPIWENGKF